MPRNTTLCYITRGDDVLLLHRVKKNRDINAGKWIGVGGGFEPGESPEECLLREVREETGLTLTAYRLRGIVTFAPDTAETEYMFLYTADGFTGELTDCDEGELAWVPKRDMESLPMWDGDRIFLKLLRENAPFFSLKLVYEGNRLTRAVLDGERIK
jgi:8-oxo-dGTP diphosphatase